MHHSPMLPDDAAQELGVVLWTVKRWLKLLTAASAVGVWVAGSLLFLLVFVLCDHWWPGGLSDLAVHLVGRSYLLGSGVWLGGTLLWVIVRRVNDVYAARLIERANPEIRNSLIDALQLAPREDLPGSVRAAVVARAAEEVDGLPVGEYVSRRRFRHVATLAGTMLAAFVFYAAISPKPIGPSLRRAFGSAVPAPTGTALEDVQPADGASVFRGEPVSFSAVLRGRRPESACVRFSADGGASWIEGEQLSLDPPAEGDAEARWHSVKAGREVQRPIQWQVVAGDAKSEVRRLDVRPVPDIASIDARYDFPGYTRLPPTTQPSGDLDALVGTRVTLRIETNVPAKNGILILGQGPDERRHALSGPTATAPAGLCGSLLVEKDDPYQIAFADRLGEANRDRITYRIHARADTPPVVHVERPVGELTLSASDNLQIEASATDDFGLTRSAVCWRPAGTREHHEQSVAVGESTPRRARIRIRVPLRQWSAPPGSQIEWWVSGWDNRENIHGQPAHQRSDSDIHRLRIIAPEVLADRSESASQPGDGKTASSGHDAGKAADGRDDAAEASSAEEAQEVASADKTGDAAEDANSDAEPQAAPKDDGSSGPHEMASADADRTEESIREFAEAHPREMQVLDQHDGEPQQAEDGEKAAAQDAAAGQKLMQQAENSQDEDSAGEDGGPAQAGEQPPGQEPSSGQQQGQSSQGPSPSPGSSEGQSQGQSQGQSKSQSENQAQGSSDGQGKGEAEGQGEGQGQGQGQGQGEGEGQGQGQGQGEGQGQGQGQGQGEGQGQGSGRGQGQGQGQGGGGEGAVGGGGKQASGGAQKLPDKPSDPQDPRVNLQPPPASSSVPPLTSARVEQLMDDLSRALREEHVDPELLDELKWTPKDALQFVHDYERAVQGGQAHARSSALPTRTEQMDIAPAADAGVRRGESTGGGVQGLRESGQPETDRMTALREAARQRVPARLQSVLRGYYDSIASQPAP